MPQRNINKSLIGIQDIALGRDTVEQTRNETKYDVKKLNLSYSTVDTTELAALDTSVYRRAEVYSSDQAYEEYLFDPAAISGDVAPDVGGGFWIRQVPSGLGTAAFADLTTETQSIVPGSVMKVGDYGVGVNILFTDFNDFNLRMGARDTPLFARSSAAPANAPPQVLSTDQWSLVVYLVSDPDPSIMRAAQVATDVATARQFRRTVNDVGPMVFYGDWEELITSDSLPPATNLVVNGGFAVSQEHGQNVLTAGPTPQFVVDQHVIYNTTGTGDISASQSNLSTFDTSISIFIDAGVTDLTGTKVANLCAYKCEAQDVYDLNNKDVVWQATVFVDAAGVLPVAFFNFDQSRSYVHDFDVVNGENQLELTLKLENMTTLSNSNGVGLNWTIGEANEGSLVHAPANNDQWVAGTFVCSTNSTLWTKIDFASYQITRVGLYPGKVAPKFQHLRYADDLHACKRYFERIKPSDFSDQLALATAVANATNAARGVLVFGVEKRTTPVLTFSNNADFEILNATGTTIAATIASAIDLQSFSVNLSFTIGSASLTIGDGCTLRTNNTGAAYLDIDARLP